MEVILDTNALSDWAEEDPELLRILPPIDLIIVPVVVIGEYRYGLLQSTHRARLEQWLTEALREVQVGLLSEITALQYAELRHLLKRKGRPVPHNDMWIAALSLQHDLPVVSNDRHFDAVDGLTRIGW